MTDVSRTDWRLVLLLWAAGLGAAAQYGKISVIFARLPEFYPEAGTSIGFAVSLVGALGILFGVVAGVLVARIGYRRAVLGGLIVGACVSAVQAFFPPLPVFLLTRVIEGAAHLAMVVAIPTMIAEASAEKDRGLSLTLWGSFFGVSFAFLFWAGVPFAERFGLSALMGAHAIYLGVMAAILAPILPRLLSGAPSAPGLGEIARAHSRIYGSARIGAPAWGWLFYTICFVSVLTVFAPFVPEDWRAFTMGAMPLTSILSSLTIGVALLKRISAVSVVILGFTLSALCAVALIWSEGSPVLALLLGASFGLVQGAGFASVPQLNEPTADRALANGGMAQMGNLGNTIGTPIMVAVIAAAGYAGLMAALALVFAGGAAVHLWLARQRERTS
ncbi:MFS transporter [Rhodobacterales bacterium HKCCE3408]|nr:MFS transporter [Rhodobacterales bacterium HKCCE3408]